MSSPEQPRASIRRPGVGQTVKRRPLGKGEAVRKACVVAITAIGLSVSANSATLTVVNTTPLSDTDYDRLHSIQCNIRFDGTIQTGDAQKLRKLLPDDRAYSGVPPVLCLNSPGGSYEEGLKIAKFLLAANVSTGIERGAHCFSACAIIFMAGNTQIEGFLLRRRRLHVLGTLGFHAPYVRPGQATYTSEQLQTMYQEGLRAIGRLIALEPGHRNDEFFPKQLIVEMLKHGPDDAFLVDTVGKAIEFSIEVAGVREPRNFDEISVQMLCNVCDNANNDNGRCEPSSRITKREDGDSMENSFLNYGPEEGGLRCTITSSFEGVKIGWPRERMFSGISGAGEGAQFQTILFFAPSAPLASLPKNGF